jgi:hypothetical protein
MSADGSELKSPLIPVFQGGIFSVDFKTPLWKRGEGEICRVEWRLELCGELQFQDTKRSWRSFDETSQDMLGGRNFRIRDIACIGKFAYAMKSLNLSGSRTSPAKPASCLSA